MNIRYKDFKEISSYLLSLSLLLLSFLFFVTDLVACCRYTFFTLFYFGIADNSTFSKYKLGYSPIGPAGPGSP